VWIERGHQPKLSRDEIRRLADLTPDARVLTGRKRGPGAWYVWANDTDGHGCRYAFYPAMGRVRIDWLGAPRGVPGTGWGAKKFLTLARGWQQAGFTEIFLTVADGNPRSKKYTGYYVWPRWGFQGQMSKKQHDRLPPELRGSLDVQTLFARQGGRAAWRKFGSRLYAMTFDLREGSESWRLFQEYVSAHS
jgi:hypothetical protein